MANIHAQIAEVKREIRMREGVYPKWVGAGRMEQREADDKIKAMKAVLATLEVVRDNKEPELGL